MLDIIGYWAGVTLITIGLLYGVVLLLLALVDKGIESITEGDHKEVLLGHKYLGKVMSLGKIKGRGISYEGWRIFLVCIYSIVLTLISTIIVFSTCREIGIHAHQDTYLELVHNLALWLTPVTSWVAITGLTLFVVHFLGRKGYKLYKTVNSIKAKLDDK